MLDVNLLLHGTALPICPNAPYRTSRHPCYVSH
nr:MAG TPA: Isoprenylcysteine carboxyl methyltransferase (ICMT) family [Caudoviricetes sp.]